MENINTTPTEISQQETLVHDINGLTDAIQQAANQVEQTPWYSQRYLALVQELLESRPDLIPTLLQYEMVIPNAYYEEEGRDIAPLVILSKLIPMVAVSLGQRQATRYIQYLQVLNIAHAPQGKILGMMLLEDVLDLIV